MRSADTYRAQRRNNARADRKTARAEKRPGDLIAWRQTGAFAVRANHAADIQGRAIMANAAREEAAKAAVAQRHIPASVAAAGALLGFYRRQHRSRVVSRIIRDLERASRAA